MNRRERRATKARVDRMGMRYACQACKAHLVDIPVSLAKKKPEAAARILASASARHREATGCAGEAPVVCAPGAGT